MGFESVTQTAIYECLKANAALATAVSTRIYDSVPQNVTFPYINIGEDIHTAWDAHYETGFSVSITVHVWSRRRGRKETKLIQGLIYEALNRVSLHAVGYDFIAVDFDGSQSFPDADGLTRHGVSTFRVLVENI